MGVERRARRKVECVMNGQTEDPPALVPAKAMQAGDIRSRWDWVEPCVWTERMLTARRRRIAFVEAIPSDGLSILAKVNHRLESRMREIRPSGSEGRGAA